MAPILVCAPHATLVDAIAILISRSVPLAKKALSGIFEDESLFSLVYYSHLSNKRGAHADLGTTKTLCFYSTLYVESTCVNSFKHSLEYFKAEKVKYWPNLPELLTGNIC